MRIGLIAAAVLAAGAAGAAEWDYKGAHGPEHWGELGGAAEVCGKGIEQSPIDIMTGDARKVEDGLGLSLAWEVATPEVLNNGHTIQASGAGGASLFGRDFDLLQVHFHAGSEHLIDGRRAPMEAHFVHASTDGDLMVVGVMIEEGAANPALGAILDAAPQSKGTATASGPVDLSAMLPADAGAWRYKGSLTTPPCSEIVTWHVMKAPVSASAAQIGAFTALFADSYRPPQPVGRRYVLTD